jgi:hypothetical protein
MFTNVLVGVDGSTSNLDCHARCSPLFLPRSASDSDAIHHWGHPATTAPVPA